MNYNMQGMTKLIPELFAMLKSAKVEIKKQHQELMANKTTSFKKKGEGKKGNFKNNDKKVATPVKKAQSWTQAWNRVLLLRRKWLLEVELPQILGG